MTHDAPQTNMLDSRADTYFINLAVILFVSNTVRVE